MSRGATNAAAAIDPTALRHAFGTFVTGVTIVTTYDDLGRPRGMTANSFTSVSLDPPLVLICVNSSAASYEAFAKASCFAVNVLHEGQVEASGIFASKSSEKFQSVDHAVVHTGAPIIRDSLTWFDCSIFDRVYAGDHMVLIGKVEAFATSAASPLGFCLGRYVSLRNPRPVGHRPAHEMFVAYLIETSDAVLLRDDGAGRLSLPVAQQRRAERVLLLDSGEALDLIPDSIFLYSIFDSADQNAGHLIYRARLADDSAALPDGLRPFSISDLPYGRIASAEQRSLLQRYAHERQDGRFGIYVDSPDGGRVAMIEAELASPPEAPLPFPQSGIAQ
ncbi:MAG TPA: flavin reductase family protein [Caulobacteraceae bacterium]|jgi:flavin reductase (DIM6/NTAB) family NADH-FMN oxidoreductase RutF|nr:flavin reductase family protein [Caulobacteraceae bacterium]